MYFEISNERNSNQLGLFERRAPDDYHFVRDRADVRQDHLYYLYFREKADKSLTFNPQQADDGNEEQKVGGAANAGTVGLIERS